MPLFLSERRALGRLASCLAVPVSLVALVGSAAPARPPLAVSRAPLVLEPNERAPLRVGASLVLETVTIRPEPHPLDGLSDQEVARLLLSEREKLGPAILGRPNRGGLLNPVVLESGPGIQVMNAERSYAMPVTVDALHAAVAEVEREFPGSVLRVGDISARHGGYIRPHRSHQAGVDVDVGFYYRTDAKWYTKANAQNLDCARTFTLLKALVATGALEYVFVDRSVQALLREYALKSGESREFLDDLFESPWKKDTLVRHAWGHITHFHARFIDPVAEETGRRLAQHVKKGGRI